MAATHILIIDDEPDICSLMKEILEDEGYRVSIAENGIQAKQLHAEQHPDLILLDIWMPDIDGISLLKEWQESGTLNSPVIMMSGHGTVETAVEATRLGAFDFIEKPVSISKLLVTIKHALETVHLQKENSGSRKYSHSIIEPLGHSEAIHFLREQVKRINQHNTAVLITGESGTGRTLFARYIHQSSARHAGPFINVRIAGMTAEEQMIELFGNPAGGSLGHFAQAKGGTLFIKDIVDLDNTVQARLLSNLENQYFSNHPQENTFEINGVRIIAATGYDLEQAVRMGQLRKELYYYLNVVPLYIPPLREHCEDIPELLEFYVNLFVNQENLPYRRFTVAAQNRLRNYSWPGNVKELKNLVQRLLILGHQNIIDLEEIEPTLNTQNRATQPNYLSIYTLPLREAREQFEKTYLEYKLQEAGGNVSKVATQVGLERTHLYRKLRALEIDPKQIKK